MKFNTGDPPKSPLKRGTYIPPFLRGARGDRSYPSSIEVSPSRLTSAFRAKLTPMSRRRPYRGWGATENRMNKDAIQLDTKTGCFVAANCSSRVAAIVGAS